ncbi:MAG: hypothetical protein WDN31_20665 [Hyphomicrobium sp.]
MLRPVAEQLAGRDLQPIDADGAEGEALALEGGVDIGVALEHVARRLRVDDLGAVDGRQQQYAGQVGEDGEGEQGCRSEARTCGELIQECGAEALKLFQRRGEAHAHALASP